MFSFAGDTVFDPFTGTATTQLAAAKWGRNSIGVEVAPAYFHASARRLSRQASRRFNRVEVRHVHFRNPDALAGGGAAGNPSSA